MALRLYIFVEPKAFITKPQGTVTVCAHAAVCTAVGVWTGWAEMGSVCAEKISVFHDVEPKLLCHFFRNIRSKL